LSRVAAKPGRGWLRLLRLLFGTALGGYLLLMAVVVLYYFGVARVAGRFLESAFTGCALLLAVTLPLFVLASWLLELWRRRSQRASSGKASHAAPPG
jgi:membrane protein implicated in regulation of membrane protease activity